MLFLEERDFVVVVVDRRTTKKTTYCGGPIAAGEKPAAICRLLRRVLALPLNMDLLRRDNRPAAIVLVYCGVLLRRANDSP